jgi:hypothetical protein
MRSRKWLALIVVVVGVQLALPNPWVQAQGRGGRRGLQLLEAALGSIRSFDVRLEVSQSFFIKNEWSGLGREATLVRRVKQSAPTIKRYAFRQVFQKGKGRIEFLDLQSGNTTGCIVCDGEVEKTWNPAQAAGSIRSPARSPTDEGMDYLTAWYNVYERLSVLKCFRERENVVELEAGPDSSDVILETGPVAPVNNIAFPRDGFRVILDARHGLMPRQIERLEDVQGKLCVATRKTVTEWKALGGGGWAPTTVVTQCFDRIPDKGTFGEVNDEVVLKVDVARSRWNTDIPADTFDLALPAGARITDQLRNVQYVTGKADTGKNLDDLAMNARNLVPTTTGRPPMPPQRTSYWLTIGLPVFLAADIVLLLVYLRRRKVRGVR